MSHVCAKSWGSEKAGWWWCALLPNHAGSCSCAGKPKPADATFFSDDDAAQIAIRNARITKGEERRARTSAAP